MKVTFEELKAAFNRVLLDRGVKADTADACAEMFARTTESGVYSHGVNRFPRFIQQLDAGDIIPDAQPKRVMTLGAIEQWDAQRSIGNLTAKKMMDRAIELAADHGIGLVALRNANHWMRGGSYGWQAAEKGYIGICWTNSIAVMPPWGAKECRIGTNPLIVAIPSTPITMVDMSMSMFSYGMLEVNRLAGRQLPVDGGFDDEGNLTKEPGVIEKNRRILPMGYWKGSGMSIVLDMIATLLSDGASVAEVTQDNSDEYGISQIFIAIEVDKLIDGPTRDAKLQRIMDYVTSAERADENQAIRLPGHEFTTLLAENRLATSYQWAAEPCRPRAGLDALERKYPSAGVLDGQQLGLRAGLLCAGHNWLLDTSLRLATDRPLQADRPGGRQRWLELGLTAVRQWGDNAVKAEASFPTSGH